MSPGRGKPRPYGSKWIACLLNLLLQRRVSCTLHPAGRPVGVRKVRLEFRGWAFSPAASADRQEFQVYNMALAFSTEKVDSVVVATLKGTIIAGGDTESLMKRVTELLDSGETRIVFDLGQVNYVDSTGIGTLLRAAAAAARKGAAIKLANLTKRIHDVLHVTRLSAVFTIFDGADKAVASFGSPT